VEPHQTLPRDVSHARYDNLGTNFVGACTPKIWEGKKHAKFGAFSDNFWLLPRISSEWIEIAKIAIALGQLRSLPHWIKNVVNFGPLTPTVKAWVLTHHKSTYSEDHISAPRECCPLKFLHVLENVQDLIAQTAPGTWVPPTIFYNKNSKNGLKVSVPTPITLGPGHVTPPNFRTWRITRHAW